MYLKIQHCIYKHSHSKYNALGHLRNAWCLVIHEAGQVAQECVICELLMPQHFWVLCFCTGSDEISVCHDFWTIDDWCYIIERHSDANNITHDASIECTLALKTRIALYSFRVVSQWAVDHSVCCFHQAQLLRLDLVAECGTIWWMFVWQFLLLVQMQLGNWFFRMLSSSFPCMHWHSLSLLLSGRMSGLMSVLLSFIPCTASHAPKSYLCCIPDLLT